MIPNIKEKQYLDENFLIIFQKYVNKKIAVYGMTEMTEVFLERCADLNVVGVMDFDTKRTMVFGLPILEVEDVIREKIEVLILLEKENETRKIYARLNEVCSQNSILLLNRFGKELYTIYGGFYKARTRNPYFQQTEEDLLEKIQNADIIYFELLDTLISYKTLYYEDIELIQQEKEKAEYDPSGVLNLFAIRTKMKETVQKCLLLNKKVYFLDSVGLPEKRKNDFFKMLNLPDINILSTEEINWRKNNQARVLYIGGKREIIKRIETGNGTSFRILSVFELLSISSYREIIEETNTLNERSILGIFANEMFNNPFALVKSFGKPTIADVKKLGYAFVGPMIAQFVLWIIQKMEEGEYENILFSTRDGYLIQKIYQMALKILGKKDAPQGIYFKTSRKLCINAGMKNASEIQGTAQQPFNDIPEKMLHNRFNVPMDKIVKYDQDKYGSPVLYSLAHKKQILEMASEYRKRYMIYIEQLGLKENKKYLFFDLCSCGTCQFYLNRILPVSIKGLYLCFYRSNERMRKEWKDKLDYFTFYENEYGYDIESNLYRDYNFMEIFMTSMDASIVSIDQNGEMIYAEEDRTQEEMKFVKDMQKAILSFCKDYYQILYIPGNEVNRHFLDKLYGFKGEKYTNKICEILDNLKLRDEWVMRTKKIEKI